MFYKINYSVEESEIGNCGYPQIQDFDKKDLNSVKYINFDVDGLIPDTEKLPRYKLHNKAKITDLISSSVLGNCLIISESLVNEFHKLNLPLNQYFNLSFVHNKKVYDNFKAFYIARDSKILDMIDWEQSLFLKTKDYHGTVIETFKFTNWEDMVSFDKTLWGGEFSLLRKLKIKYSDSYDIIKFNYFGFPSGYICTEKVKSLVEENCFTGFRFEPLEGGIFI